MLLRSTVYGQIAVESLRLFSFSILRELGSQRVRVVGSQGVEEEFERPVAPTCILSCAAGCWIFFGAADFNISGRSFLIWQLPDFCSGR